MKQTDKAGYLMLGVAIDYFIFKPVRTLKPLWTFGLGFVLGAVYVIGVSTIRDFINVVFN